MNEDSLDSIFHQVQNTRLYQQVINQIKELIDQGHLRPGDKLPPERELSSHLGVSRAVLREACRVLESRGILITRQGGGRFLREVPLKESLGSNNVVLKMEKSAIMDILEARLVLETQTTAFAAMRISPKEIIKMEELCKLMDQDFERYELENGGLQFHYAIARASHNFVLQHIGEFQLKLLHDLEQRRVLGTSAWRHLNYEHVDILNAIKNRDSERASELMRGHLIHLKEKIEFDQNANDIGV